MPIPINERWMLTGYSQVSKWSDPYINPIIDKINDPTNGNIAMKVHRENGELNNLLHYLQHFEVPSAIYIIFQFLNALYLL